MILIKTQYETHNSKLLAIVEVFETWRHKLKSCQYKFLVFMNYNNLHHFMDTKNLSFRQVCLAQKLLKYYFQINYYQSKADGAGNAPLQYPQ